MLLVSSMTSGREIDDLLFQRKMSMQPDGNNWRRPYSQESTRFYLIFCNPNFFLCSIPCSPIHFYLDIRLFIGHYLFLLISPDCIISQFPIYNRICWFMLLCSIIVLIVIYFRLRAFGDVWKRSSSCTHILDLTWR